MKKWIFFKVGMSFFVFAALFMRIPDARAFSISDIDNSLLYEVYIGSDDSPAGYYYITIEGPGNKVSARYIGRPIKDLPFLFEGEKKISLDEAGQGVKWMRTNGTIEWRVQHEKERVFVTKNGAKFLKIFEDIPVMTLEAMILSFIGADPGNERLCYWFEGEKKQKRFSIHAASEQMDYRLGDKTCRGYRIQINWKGSAGGKDQHWFTFYITELEHIPVRIETASGRWTLALYGLGKEEEVNLKTVDMRNTILKHFKKSSPMILDETLTTQWKGDKLSIDYVERKPIPPETVYNVARDILLNKLRSNGMGAISKSESGNYVVSLTKSELHEALGAMAARENLGFKEVGGGFYFDYSRTKLLTAAEVIDLYTANKGFLSKLLSKFFKNFHNGPTGPKWRSTYECCSN